MTYNRWKSISRPSKNHAWRKLPAPIASSKGTDLERLVKDAALRLLEEDVLIRAAIREGIAQADRGAFIEEAEMDSRLERLLRS